MAKAIINGINMHYQVKGEGPDVIMIHGVTSTLAVWYAGVMPELAKQFRVTAYDLRGHGYSQMTPTGYTSRHLADDVMALMDHLDIDRAMFVGHSFGGAIALHLAALHPERVEALAVADTGLACMRHMRNIKDWPGWELWKDELAAHDISFEGFTDDADRMIRRSFEIPRQFGMRKGEKRSTRRLQKLIDETSIIQEFREVAGLSEGVIAQIDAPTLALYGAQSPYHAMAARLAELMPRSAWEIMDDTGHFYLLQSPQRFAERILAFLTDPVGYLAGLSQGGVTRDGTTGAA